MYGRFQIPGETDKALTGDFHSRPTSTVVTVLFFLLVFSGGGYYVLHSHAVGAGQPEGQSTQGPAPARPISMTQTEDLLRHIDSADKNISKAAEETKRSQEWIRRALPAIDAEHLGMERQRLTSASASSDAARRDLEEVRTDIEILKNALSEGSHQ